LTEKGELYLEVKGGEGSMVIGPATPVEGFFPVEGED
jgi:hypothetical protein